MLRPLPQALSSTHRLWRSLTPARCDFGALRLRSFSFETLFEETLCEGVFNESFKEDLNGVSPVVF